MSQPTNLFALQAHHAKLDQFKDILVDLKTLIDWERFRPILTAALRSGPRKGPAGAKGYDLVLMFKILILQHLYNLSDAQTEFQIMDRHTFKRFLDLNIGDKVPDEKTIWVFRTRLIEADVVKQLFEEFNSFLDEQGFRAEGGQIVDAAIVRVPARRDTREDNTLIKEGGTPETWSENTRRQKDCDAKWTQKRKQNYFGYKNHICVDAEHKFIRSYEVTAANVHDSRVLMPLLDDSNPDKRVWADAAYVGAEIFEALEARGYEECINRRAYRNKPLSDEEKERNREKSRTRSRVEHIFGVQLKRAKNAMLYGVGIMRIGGKIGLHNLATNMGLYRVRKLGLT